MGRPGRRLGAGALAALAGALAAGGARAFEQKEFKVRAAGFPPPPPDYAGARPPARLPARPAVPALEVAARWAGRAGWPARVRRGEGGGREGGGGGNIP